MFEKWQKTKAKPVSETMFIRFGDGGSLSLSSALCRAIVEKGDRFDIYVDSDARVVGIAPRESGEYKFKTIPCCVGATEFVKKFNPKMRIRLPVIWQKGDDKKAQPPMWIASLDGNKMQGEE